MPEEHQYRRMICSHCGYTIDIPVYCGNRFCAICSLPRLKRVRQRLTALVSQLHFRSGYDMKHLTLTIRNKQHLPDMITYLIHSFKLLRRTKFWKDHVAGGAFVIEVTGEPGSWHAHLHVVIHCKWMRYETLLATWMHVSKGRGVYITRLPKSQIVKYLTKYLTKPAVDEAALEAANGALSHYRLFQTFGTWHSLKIKIPKVKSFCPKCKVAAWIPFDILYRDFTLPEHGRHPPRSLGRPAAL